MRAAVILIFIMLPSCDITGPCKNHIFGQAISPNGKMAAVIFDQDCGATTGHGFDVSVGSVGTPLVGGGNVLTIDQVPGYSDIYKPVWISNTSLAVAIPEGARVFTKNEEVEGVKIIYRLVQSQEE